ncbi:MAG: DUF3108 domain-containing protein [Rhodocyclaceae bacterium]
MRAELGLIAVLACLPLAQAPAADGDGRPPAVGTAADAAWPRHGSIRFELYRGSGGQATLIGHTTHVWRHDGKDYFLQGVTEAAGLAAVFATARIVQTSEGRMTPAGLVPQTFRVERKGRKTERARFDWQGMKLTLYAAERVRLETALEPGAQDVLSQIYQLGLAGGTDRSEMMVASGKRYRRHIYATAGHETIETPFGVLRTRHLKATAPDSRKTMELWLAPEYRQLPLRIRYTDRKGRTFEQRAVALEADGTKTATTRK